MANKVNNECSTTQADDLPGNHHNPQTPTKQTLAPTDGNTNAELDTGNIDEEEKIEDDDPVLMIKLSKKCQQQQITYEKKDEKEFLQTLTNISDKYYNTDEECLRRNGLPTLLSNGRSSLSSKDIEGWKDGVEDALRGNSGGKRGGKVGGSGSIRKTRSKGEHRKSGNENFKFEFYNDPRKYLKQYKRFHSCTGQATKLRQNEAIPLDYPDMSYTVWDRPEATFPLKLDAIPREGGGSVMMKVGKGNLITAPLVSASSFLELQQKIQTPPPPQNNDQISKSLEAKKSKEQKLLLGPPFPHRISTRSASPTTPQSLTELLKVQHNSTEGMVTSNNSLPPQSKQNQNNRKRQPNGHKTGGIRAQSSKNQQQQQQQQQQLNYNHPPTFAIMSAKLSSKHQQFPWLAKELLPQKQQTDKATVEDKRPKTTTTTGKEDDTKHNDYTVARMLLNWRRTYETTLKNNRSLTKPNRTNTAQCSDTGVERSYVSKSATGGRPVVASNVSMYDTSTTRNGDCMKARPITHIGFRSRSCGFRQLNKMKIH